MFEIHTVESAPAGSKAALEDVRERIGFIPNLAATMGGAPALIEGFGHLQRVLRETSLTGAEREVVGLTVSYANTCAYSMAAHSTFAARHGLPVEVINALRAGLPLPDERLQVLHEFTRDLLRHQATPPKMEAAGFTTQQVLEVIAQVGYTSLANWVANLADTPLDDAFKAQYWSSAIL
jgi:AhpD family alkylhydroperoxidase